MFIKKLVVACLVLFAFTASLNARADRDNFSWGNNTQYPPALGANAYSANPDGLRPGGVELAQNNFYEGLYLGANADLTTANSFTRISSVTIFPTGAIIRSAGNQVNAFVLPNVDVGYGLTFGRLFVAPQVEADFYSRTERQNYLANGQFVARQFVINMATRLRDAYGVGLKVGFLSSPSTALFAQLGGMWTDLRLQTNWAFTRVTNNSVSYVAGSKKAVSGVRFGLGVQRFVTRHLSVLLSYFATVYSEPVFTNFLDTVGVAGIGRATFNAKGKYWSNTLRLGLQYNFNNHAPAGLRRYTPVRYNGIFVGIGGGVVWGVYHLVYKIFTPGAQANIPLQANFVLQSPQNTTQQGFGAVFTAEAGYGHTLWNYVYLGGLFNVNFLSTKKRQDYFYSTNVSPGGVVQQVGITSVIRTRLKNQYGFAFRPGVWLSSTTLFFLQAGMVWNKVSVSVNDLYHETAFAVPAQKFALSVSKTLSGVQLGLGIVQSLGHNLFFTAKYLYTNTGSVNYRLRGTILNGPPLGGPFQYTNRGSVGVWSNAVDFGVQYLFAV